MTAMKLTQRRPESVSNRSTEDCPVVTLTEQEFRIGWHIAAARTISYEGVSDEPFGSQDRFEAHLTGVLGEVAVAKAARSEMDKQIYVHGDAGHDLPIAGYSADVKATATHVPEPDLIVPADSEPTAEMYVLAHRIEERKVRLVGWADKDTLTDRAPEREPGSTLNYIVPFDELRPIPTK
jgi:hypothetical protein